MSWHVRYLAGVVLLAPVVSLLADPIPIDQLVVFGDSLSDNGNAAGALASVGQTTGNYAANAFTDGPQTSPASSGPYGLWIDQFAGKFGVPDPEPFVVNTPSATAGGNPGLGINPLGTNFAVASALAGNNPAFSSSNFLSSFNGQAPGTTNQVAIFSSLNNGKASPNDLYTFWGGANNIFDSFGSLSGIATFPLQAKDAADAIAGNIATLAGEGGKYFLWLNLPPLGQVPYVNDNSDPLVRILGKAAGNGAALIFNDEMASDISSLEKEFGIDIIDVNTNALFNQITANPGKYGFVDVKDAGWCGTDGVPACAKDNPNGFLFWDELHPTTATDAILAQYVYSYVAPEFEPASDLGSGVSPASVPEPGAQLLELLGMIALLAIARRTRSGQRHPCSNWEPIAITK